MEDKLNSLEKNITTVSQELVSLKESIAAGFIKSQANFGVIEKQLAALAKQVSDLNFKVASLDSTTHTGLSDVGNKIESLSDEIAKISVVTNYDEMFKNQQGLTN